MAFRSTKSIISLAILGIGVSALLWAAFNNLFALALTGSALLIAGLSSLYLTSKPDKQKSGATQRTQRLKLFKETLLNTVPIPVFYKDNEGRYLGCNEHFRKLLDISEAQIIGKTVFEVWPRDLAETYHQKDLELLEQPGLQRYDYKIQDAHGKTHDVVYNKGVFHNERGEVAGIVGTLLDVTEAKENAKKLDATVKQLSIANNELRLASRVFTDMHEGITITDENGTIVDVNDAFTRITGYARKDAIGKTPRILKSGLQSKEFYEAMWQQLIETGGWSGQIWNRSESGEIYACLLTISAVRDENGSVQNYVALHSDITRIKEHEQELARMAHYDALTGLLNRTLLEDRLQNAIAFSQRTKTLVAVAYIDLDGFKEVNDNFGHDVGDELLISISQRMKNALREVDTLLRVGGDEFIAILANLESRENGEQIFNRLLEAITKVAPKTSVVHVSASIGVTLYPEIDTDDSLLVQHADLAMYEAKRAGKNRIRFFTPDQADS